MYGAGAEVMNYRPTSAAALKHRAKKASALLLYVGIGALILLVVGPGLASERSPGLDYWTTLAAVVAALVLLVFLFVITWNEHLAHIDDGMVTLPFPIRREAGSRTRRIRIEEITEVELTVNSIGRRGAELRLQDGTRLFLPHSVFGEQRSKILEALERHVKGRSVNDVRAPDREG
jgi:hypothetical protein